MLKQPGLNMMRKWLKGDVQRTTSQLYPLSRVITCPWECFRVHERRRGRKTRCRCFMGSENEGNEEVSSVQQPQRCLRQGGSTDTLL